MNDGSDNRDSDQRGHDNRWHLHQQIQRDEHRDDRTPDIHRHDGRVGRVASWHPVANAETADHLGRMRLSAGDARDWNIDVAANQTRQQSRESQLRWQAKRHERVADYMDLEQDEEERQDKEKENRIEEEKGCEKHAAILAVTKAGKEAAARAECVSIAPAHRALFGGNSYRENQRVADRERDRGEDRAAD